MTYIANQSLENKRVKIGDVAENTGTPEAFTAKILGTLVKEKLLASHKGPLGGFEIDVNQMKNIMLADIVYAIDGDSIYNGCALGLDQCSPDNPCPMHEHFVDVRESLKKMLKTTSIYDLATNLKSGKSTLLRI